MRILAILSMIALAVAAGCGGSGGTAVTAPDSSAATVSVSTARTSGDGIIYGVEVTLHLPAGVTVPADPATGELLPGVLQPFDPGALAGGRYIPATQTTQSVVQVNIAKATGFPVGPCATLNCQLAPGTILSADAFSFGDFSAKDASGSVVDGIGCQLSVRTQ